MMIAITKQAIRTPIMIRYRRSRYPMSSDFDGRACVTRCTRPDRALGKGFTLPPYARTQTASRTVPVRRACGRSLYSEVRRAVTQRGRARVPLPPGRETVSNRTYRVIEIVGTSPDGVEPA